MHIPWISIPALFAIHTGFAALLGALGGQMRTRSRPFLKVGVLIAAGLLLISAGLALPVSTEIKTALLAICTLAAGLAGWRADWMLKNQAWAWGAAGLTMSLILIWSAWQPAWLPAIALGLTAGLAAVLTLRRALSQQPH